MSFGLSYYSKYKDKPLPFIVLWSPPRTGSTLIWQILNCLFEDPSYTSDKWTLPNKIQKTHNLDYTFLNNHDVFFVATVRNPMDAMTSYMIVNKIPFNDEEIENTLKLYLQYFTDVQLVKKTSNSLVLDYDDFYTDYNVIYDQIERIFDITIDTDQRNAMNQEFGLTKNKQRADSMEDFSVWDKESFIHGDHINSDKLSYWKERIPEHWHDRLQDEFESICHDDHETEKSKVQNSASEELIVQILSSKIRMLENQIADKEEVIQSLKQSDSTDIYLKEQIENGIMEKNRVLREVQLTIQSKNKTISELQNFHILYSKQIEILQSSISDKDLMLNDLQSSISAKDLMLNDLQSSISAKDLMLNDLQSSISAKDLMLNDLHSSISAKDLMLNDLQSSISAKDLMLNDLHSSISAKDLMLNDLQKEMMLSYEKIIQLQLDIKVENQHIEKREEHDGVIDKLLQDKEQVIQELKIAYENVNQRNQDILNSLSWRLISKFALLPYFLKIKLNGIKLNKSRKEIPQSVKSVSIYDPSDVRLPKDFNRTFKSGLAALAIPCVLKERDEIMKNFQLWDNDFLRPYDSIPEKHELFPIVFILNGNRSVQFEEDVKKAFYNTHIVRDCFSQIDFHYCGLSGDDDTYESDYTKKVGPKGYKSGPNNQFYRSLAILSVYGEYSCYMEPDCYPVRSNWLGTLTSHVYDNSPFWVLGSIYRGISDLDEKFKNHLNGNAIYASGNSEFREFMFRKIHPFMLELINGEYPWLAYDCALELYLHHAISYKDKEKWQDLQNIYHKFKATSYIQNHSGFIEATEKRGHSLDYILSHDPHTCIVHGRHLRNDVISLLAEKNILA